MKMQGAHENDFTAHGYSRRWFHDPGGAQYPGGRSRRPLRLPAPAPSTAEEGC